MGKLYVVFLTIVFSFLFSLPVFSQAPSCSTAEVNPVTGINGVVYLNSCFAEQAGLVAGEYVQGVNFGDCIDHTRIDPTAICTTVMDPVCGCNGITYVNPCTAEASGVVSYTPGPCTGKNACYDPAVVLDAASVTVNATTGVVTYICAVSANPVCGCDGVTYENACVAEASGIATYGLGPCTGCVDPAAADPLAPCPTTYDPVCGCNGVTYLNACEATKAGVLSTTPGLCAGSSEWCVRATPIQCGDFLANETTIGGTNLISSYASCTDGNFFAAEKVYVFYNASVSDIQIGLEILTPGLDLDLLLLTGDCSQPTCIDASLSSNSGSPNEGIVLENAPVGTYYIVVDGENAGSTGNYNLELSCGSLDCSVAVALTCGVTYSGSNATGTDAVSGYGCEGVINVENNGPEVVHTFTIAESGNVNIYLTGLTANLELFLLDDCDQNACIDFSENTGTGDEQINANLLAGTYYVVVDGYNGAVSNYSLRVECPSGCGMDIVGTSVVEPVCGFSSGSITITSAGGLPPYLVSWVGPDTGSVNTTSNINTITNLSAGRYQVSKTDVNGCTDTQEVLLASNTSMAITTSTVPDLACGATGSVNVIVTSGSGPYEVTMDGPTRENFITTASNFNVDISAGSYEMQIEDANGCIEFANFQLGFPEGAFYFSATTTPTSCRNTGAIHVQTFNGAANYAVTLVGPSGGVGTYTTTNFSISNLSAGDYVLTVTDGNGCVFERDLTVENDGVAADIEVMNGACGRLGSVMVKVNKGKAPYSITWRGPVDGDIYTTDSMVVIPNLPDGDYTILVEDDFWCSVLEVVTIDNSQDGITVAVSQTESDCGDNLGLLVQIANGRPGYTIELSGSNVMSLATNNSTVLLSDLNPGTTFVTVRDLNGCRTVVTLGVAESNPFEVFANVVLGSAATRDIQISVEGGAAPYQVNWTGPSTGRINSLNGSVTINNAQVGVYQITVIDNVGCIRTKNVFISNQESDLLFTVTPSPARCGLTGSIQVDIQIGNPGFTLSWSGPVNGTRNLGSATSTVISNLPTGVYTVTLRDANNLSTSEIVNILQGESDLEVQATPVPGTCGDRGEILLNITGGSPGFVVKWQGITAGWENTSSRTFRIGNLPTGQNMVEVTDAQGCVTSLPVTVVNTNTNMTFSLLAEHANCSTPFGKITVPITGGVGPYQIEWTGPRSGAVTITNSVYTVRDLPIGDYSFLVTDSEGCSKVNYVGVKLETALGVGASTAEGDCGKPGTIWVGSSKPGPFYISWTGPMNGSTNITGNSYDILNAPPGNYAITLEDANGCRETVQITLGSPESGIEINTFLAENGCGNYNVIRGEISGGAGPYQISWSGARIGSMTRTVPAFEIANLPTGNYRVRVKDASGCEAEITHSVIVSEVDIFDGMSISGTCGNNGGIGLDITEGNPPYKISWTGPSGGSRTTNQTWVDITGLVSGTYMVSVTNAENCLETGTFTITNSESNLDMNASLLVNECGQYNTIWIDITGGKSPYIVNVRGANLNNNFQSNTGALEITDLAPDNYELTLTDGNGCEVVETIAIVENTLDIFELSPEDGLCGETTGLFIEFTSDKGPYSVSWTGPSSGTMTTLNPKFELHDLAPGTYVFSVKDSRNCVSTTTFESRVPESALDMMVKEVETNCGSPASMWISIFSGTAPYTVSWTGPESGSQITFSDDFDKNNLPPGTYVVTITDANGCTSSQTITIGNVSTLEMDASLILNECGTYNTIWIDILGGTGPYVVRWTGPQSGSQTQVGAAFEIFDLPQGRYTVYVTDANNCWVTQTINVAESQANLFEAVVNSDPCNGAGSIVVNFTPGFGPYNLSWTGPASGNFRVTGTSYEIKNLPSGSYTIQATGANSECRESGSYAIVNVESNLDFAASLVANACGQLNGITLNITSGTGPYIVSYNSGAGSTSTQVNTNTWTFENLAPASYLIRVEDANGCSVTRMMTVTDAAIDLFDYSIANGTCGGNDVITFEFFTDQAPYKISWTGSSTGSITSSGNIYLLSNLSAGNYQMTVEDSRGCTGTADITIAPRSGGGMPVADFTFTLDGVTATFVNTSSEGTYAWNFGDGMVSTEKNPVHEFCDEGTYNVCLEVTDACGTTQRCFLIDVALDPNLVTLNIMESRGAPGAVIELPVIVTNLSKIASLAGSLTVDDPTVARITGVTEGKITPILNVGNLTFNYYDNSGLGVDLADNDTLFFLTVELLGTLGQATPIRFANAPLQMELAGMQNGAVSEPDFLAIKGMVTIVQRSELRGTVTTFTGAGVKGVEIHLKGSDLEIIGVTDNAGNYLFEDLPADGNYVVEPSMADNPANGLSTYALFVGQRFILGLEPAQVYSPYQIIAGDANCNGAFTTLDLFLIQRLIIGTESSFGNCGPWVFVSDKQAMPESFNAYNVFPYSSRAEMSMEGEQAVDFTAVKVGDILGRAKTGELHEVEASPRSGEVLAFDLVDQTVTPEKVIELAFTSKDFDNIASYQFALGFDADKLEFVGVDKADAAPLNSVSVGTYNVNRGELRFSWFSMTGEGVDATEEPVFTLRFKATAAAASLKDLIWIDKKVLSSVAHTPDAAAMDITLNFIRKTIPTPNRPTLPAPFAPQFETGDYTVFQNQPNPFVDITVIRFELPRSMDLQMDVFDSMGALVRSIRGQYDKGMQEISFEKGGLAPGTYFYTLKTEDFVATKSMVIVE
ncbi:MAG: cohesin domain-containing protein [Saprospiraceae bacterium]|nr:cohesin domain-containing protein [Saprospiraceae bacterium]